MKKKLFYVVEKELTSINDDGNQETTGNKNVAVYTIEDDTLRCRFYLDLLNTDNTEDAIQDWLDENGYGKSDFEMKPL